MARRQQARTTSAKAQANRRRHPLATDHRLSPAELVERLRHSNSAVIRAKAIRLLEKYLRRGDRFNATWEALGGARGIAALMAELSVADVRNLCARLGRTASAANARDERRTGIAELISILSSGETDSRPLRKFYQSVVPASHDEVVEEWEDRRGPVKWTNLQGSCLLRGHREQYEQRFLRDIFSKTTQSTSDFGQNQELFRGNLAFSEQILRHLLSIDSNQAGIPHDFMPAFVMPLLNRLGKRRTTSTPELNKFLGLIVQCVKQHPKGLKGWLSLTGTANPTPSDNLLAFTLQRWARVVTSGGDRELIESYLTSLLTLLPSYNLKLKDVYVALILNRDDRPQHAQIRYDLLRLIFKNVERFSIDLESDNPASLQRLRDLSSIVDLWPVELFLFLPVDKSLALFRRLERVHQGESFIFYTGYIGTIFKQEDRPFSHSQIDIDIARTVLQRKQDPSGSTWLDGVRKLVKDRMKKATETREPQHRAFWAKAALNLCVAAGDIPLVHITFAWAQRFVKDPLAGPEVFGRGTMTRELIELLSAVPVSIDFKTSERLEQAILAAKRDIEPANALVVTLIQTAISAVREPGFKTGHWSKLLNLPDNISRARIDSGESIRRLAAEIGASDPPSIVADTIWKPTMILILKVEALMSDPSASKFSTGRLGKGHSVGLYMQQLPKMEPQLQAEMTAFFMEAMQAHLSPAHVKNQIGFVVSAVSKLAHSSEPSRAIPFIRPIIQNSDDSSSHRQLVTNGFLESLPAQDALEFLHNMATAMTDMMKAQNSRSWKESGANEQPAVKVTTVKMVADLLNGNLVVDANTSCEILVSLLREARHIDARIAIITGLLSTLEESTSTPALRNHILDVFEESVLPMASQLNERRPTTEEEWKATEMPEVSEESSILTLLIHRIRSKSLQQEDRSRLVQIIMRALEQSARNNQRWMRLFVDKHGFELGSVDKLFVGPAHHAALRNILPLEFESLPDALFDALQAMILQNVDPSPGILHITDSIKADATLRGSIAGKHWLAQMDNSGRDAFHFGVESILELIQRGATSPQSQVRIGKLRQFITAVAERWMRQGEADLVYELAGKLTLSSRTQEGASMEWRANAIKALESIIHAAEALRKEGSSVSVMPNTFRLRLNILRLTYWTGDELATESQVTAVAEMVSNLVDRLVNRRRPYHSDFQLLKSEIYQIALSVSDHARAAIALARLHQEDLEDAEPPLAAYLRFELIVEGLKKSDPSKKEVKDDVKKMLEKWTTCSAEDLRVMGQQLDKELRKRKGWDTVEVDVAMIDA